MRISSVKVHNFRSVPEAAICLYDYSLLIGANNVGKSNVIDAIRAFYGHHKYTSTKDKPKFNCEDEEVWIEIEYVLTDPEQISLAEKYHQDGNRLIVRRYLETNDTSRKGKLFAYTGDVLADAEFYGAANVQKGKLGKIIHIPASSQVKDHTKTSGPSAWRDVVNDIFTGLVGTSPSFAELTQQFEAFEENFKDEETEDQRSLDGLIGMINQDIEGWDAQFQLHIDPIDPAGIVKNLVRYQILDGHLDGEEIDEEQYGQGFQRHLIFTLLKLAATYQAPRGKRKMKDFSPDMTLLLFEEPEAYLHPAQQMILYRSLRTLSTEESYQVVVTSHSPQFVSYISEEIPSIIRLSREGGRTIIGQLDEDQLQEIFSENQIINEIVESCGKKVDQDDLLLDMETVKYGIWLNSERCQTFFAERVLLVEGATEQVLLNHLINRGEMQIPLGGIYILDCMGKWNMHRFMNLLDALNISYSLLLDADQGEVQTRIGEMLQEKAAERSAKFAMFPNELEDFLGIDKTNKPHRKPQHVMLKYYKGAIGDDRKQALLDVVNELLN